MTATALKDGIVIAARGYIGTPFRHQGRLPGVGLDCVGLVMCALREAGMPAADYTRYPRTPNGMLLDEIEARFLAIQSADAVPGDMLVFSLGARRHPWHVGIVTPRGIVHAHAAASAVCEHSISPAWRARIAGAFDLTRRPV